MRRLVTLAVVVLAALAGQACDDPEPVGLGTAGPLITEYEKAIEQFDEIVGAIDPETLPDERGRRIDRINLLADMQAGIYKPGLRSGPGRPEPAGGARG